MGLKPTRLDYISSTVKTEYDILFQVNSFVHIFQLFEEEYHENPCRCKALPDTMSGNGKCFAAPKGAHPGIGKPDPPWRKKKDCRAQSADGGGREIWRQYGEHIQDHTR